MAIFRILGLVSKNEIRSREFLFSSRSLRVKIINLNLVSMPVNWNPPSLLQISPTPTLEPSTQLPLVYSSYMYPPSSEERDSKKDGFKLDLFNTEAGISRVTGELLPPDWLKQKSVCI